jgi:hypothetical protein
MAALYFYHSGNREVFRGGLQVLTSVRFDFLGDLLQPGNQAIITGLSVQAQDVVQFFLTFDDFISWFYFGKGLGTLQIQGLLMTCGIDATFATPGLNVLLGDVMRRMRGKSVTVSLGNAAFSGVLTGLQLNMVQDPSPLVEFSLNLAIVNHTLPSNRPTELGCSYNPAQAGRSGTAPTRR